MVKASKKIGKTEIGKSKKPKISSKALKSDDKEGKDNKSAALLQKLDESIVVKKTSKTSNRFRQIEKITGKHKLERGIIYLGHIPHGFFEKEMKEFFEQFGKVTRIRLARSKKTARSKGYGFIEFEKLQDAAIAADTMNERFMMDRMLVWHVVDDQDVHRNLFKGCNKKWQFVSYQRINTNKINSAKTDQKKWDKVKRLLEQEMVKRERIKEFGIKYDFPGYKAIVDNVLNQVGNAE